MILKPLDDNVLIFAEDWPKQLASGMVIPGKVKPGQGKVIDIGPWVTSGIIPGDMVFFTKFSANEIEYEGIKYLILPQKEVLCKEILDD